MAKDGHDRLNAGATFGELSAHGVAEPVRGHCWAALPIQKSCLATGDPQRF